MRVRPIKPTDLPEANAWRAARNVAVLVDDMLPSTGVVCERDDGQTQAMAWLYITNSKLSYLAWPVTRPGLSPRIAKEALTLVFVELFHLAKILGFTSIISTAESRSLIKLLKQCGMIETGHAHAMLSIGVE